MVNIFFRGIGAWFYDHFELFDEPVSGKYPACGVFRLNEEDEITYRHTKSLSNVVRLLPSNHPDCEFSRMIKLGKLISVMLDLDPHISSEDADHCFFEIDHYRNLNLNIVEANAEAATQKSEICVINEIPQIKNGVLEAEKQPHLSKDLAILNEAPSMINGCSPYLDQSHPMYSNELDIAIQAWNAVLFCNPIKPKTGSRKKLIENCLEIHYRILPKEAKRRIATLLNPDKNGGAPSTF